MTRDLQSQLAPPPSRSANPFATCWTRPGALSFRFGSGESVGHLIAMLAARRWRGAILGPHGSGKSTLLEVLKPAIIAADRSVLATCLRDGQRRLPHHFLASLTRDTSWVVIIDGYEQLGWPARLHLSLRCRSMGAGLIVTSHKPIRMPTLIELAPDRQLIERLVGDLCAEVSTTITRADVAASHACHGSNVREIFFDLYDHHEEQRRKSNSLAAAP